MIKFTMNGEGGARIIGLGLSRANCDRLLDHQPIHIDLRKDLHLPWKGAIVILAGETEKDMQDALREFITEDTIIVHVDPRLEEESEPEHEPKFQQLSIQTAHTEERGWFVLLEFPSHMARKCGITAKAARAMSAALVNAAEEAESHGW